MSRTIIALDFSNKEQVLEFLKQFDVIFPITHGTDGEDGKLQGLLDLFKLKYVGSKWGSNYICMDKEYSKLVFKDLNIPIVPYQVYEDKLNIPFPVIVKPANGGSSIGITKANNEKEFKKAIKIAKNYNQKVIVEKFINARELECAVLEDKNLIISNPGEIKCNSEFYDYKAKYKKEILEFLSKLDEPVYVKIGMELTYACGLDIVKEVKNMGHKIFLDLKLHDIPNTVKGGMKNLAKLGVDIVNCHCAGGIEMMKAAKQGVLEGTPEGQEPAKLIGVTVLTSTSKESMNEELGIPGEVIDTVIHYAKNAKEAGLDGVVCSVHEAKAIHEACGDDFLTVTPGIRLAGNSVDDQKRVATPEFAKEQGCDMIVVGRSITKSEDPKATYKAIEEVMG